MEANSIIYNSDGLLTAKNGDHFYIKYDAGAHQIVIREDEITEEEARRIMSSPAEATKVLFELQQRLIQAGIAPCASHIKR